MDRSPESRTAHCSRAGESDTHMLTVYVELTYGTWALGRRALASMGSMPHLRILTLLVALLAMTGPGFAALLQMPGGQVQGGSVQAPAHQAQMATAVSDHHCCPKDNGHQHSNRSHSDGLPSQDHSCPLCKAGFHCQSPQPMQAATMLIGTARPERLVADAPSAWVLESGSRDELLRPPALL